MASHDRPPTAAVPGEEAVGLDGPLAAGLVHGKVLAAGAAPGVDEGLDHAPAGFDSVGALEQDGVADHAVIDQRLVSGARRNVDVMEGPGILTLNCKPMHSSGWMRSARKFSANRSTGVSRNMAKGACLNLIATSVDCDFSALPVRK